MPDKLNDLTRAEIAQIKADIEAYRDRAKRDNRACLCCDKVLPMRPDQKFCSTKCRVAFAQAAARTTTERLQIERTHWLIEREALVREIASLRAQLDEKKP